MSGGATSPAARPSTDDALSPPLPAIMIVKRARCLIACLFLTGCAHLLPRGDSEGPSQFESFEAAAAAFDRIVSHRTTVDGLIAR